MCITEMQRDPRIDVTPTMIGTHVSTCDDTYRPFNLFIRYVPPELSLLVGEEVFACEKIGNKIDHITV